MSPTPPADADDADDSLPSVLRGPTSARPPGDKRDDPSTPAVEPVLHVAPKKETLKLFPFSGSMGATPQSKAPADTPERETRPTPPSESGRRGARHQQTPKARAAPDRPRAKGPQPRDPAAVHAALEPLLAWMPEEQRPEVIKLLLCGEYESVLRTLSEHRQRYPKNLTIGKAVEVVEEAACSRLLHELGPLNSEIIVVNAEPSVRGNVGSLMRLARQASTVAELLENSPFGRVRTLQLVSQLVQDGTLAVRLVPKATGFGVGTLSSPSVETIKRRLSEEIPSALGSFADVKAAADAPRTPTPGGEENEVDALFAQLERATLPDPSEVAASLQQLRDRSLTPAMRPKVVAELRKRFDDRLEQHDASAASEEAITDKPEVVQEDSESASPLPTVAPEPVESLGSEPKVATKPAETAAETPTGSDDPEDPLAVAASEASSGEVGSAADLAPDADAKPAEPERSAPKSIAPDAAMYAELKRLRPKPIREGEDEARQTPVLLLAVGAIGLIAIGLSLYALSGRQPDPPPRQQSPAEPTRAPTSGPTALPTNTATALTAPPTHATPTAPAVENVTLEIEASPHYAQVYLDGTLITKPFKRTVAKDDRKHELRIEAGGYKTQTRTFKIKGDTNFVVALEPILGRKKEEPAPDAVYP